MGFVDGFLTPLIKTGFVIGIIGFILWVVGRFIYKFYIKTFKWWFKYKVKKKKIEKRDLDWVLDAISRALRRDEIKIFLLKHDIPKDRIAEMLYLFDELNLKVGDNNAKATRRDEDYALGHIPRGKR